MSPKQQERTDKRHDNSRDGYRGDWLQRGDVLVGYLTREALAEQLGISARTLMRWELMRTGPPPTRIGRDVLYSVASVRAWLAAREQKMPRAHTRNVRAAASA